MSAGPSMLLKSGW